MPNAPKLAALAVVVEAGRVLLVRRRNPPDAGLWGFPGGHVEWGETALDAAARECLEETGIIAVPRSYLTNIDVVGAGYHYLLAVVHCRFERGLPVPSEEVYEARWCDPAEVLEDRLAMSRNVAKVLKLALKIAD